MVRSSLGRSIDLSTTRTVEERYPLYAMPVKHLMELKEWIPHQDLLAAGKLIEVKPDDTETEVIFCSHQWTHFDQPDPTNEQLKALQTVIRKLMAGKTDVKSNAMLDAIYQYKMRTSGSDWAKAIPNLCFWIDYFSIPQPGALIKRASEKLTRQLDVNGDGIIEQAELSNAVLDDEAAPSSEPAASEPAASEPAASEPAMQTPPSVKKRRGSDHRLMTGNADEEIKRLIEQLKAAVDTIPSYIERSSMMWVVVPPTPHANLKDTICDFESWRRRGWCRMEFAASKLACGEDMPLMVIQSAVDPPEYFNPCDIFKLCAARGDFSVESDKDKVNATLITMLRAKANYYEKDCDDLTLARILRAFGPIFVPREAFGSALPSAAGTATAGETAVDKLKRFMGWRGAEAEAAWEAETGWNLLTLAAAMDDEPAVDELLTLPEEAKQALLNAKGVTAVAAYNAAKKNVPRQRREPLGQKLTQYADGMTPLMAAMTFAKPAIVEKMLDAGAPVERDGLNLLGEKPCTFRGAATAGRADNVRLFLARHPEYTNATNPFGSCALHFAAFSSQCLGQAEVIRTLLDAGATASINQNNLIYGTPLAVHCQIHDQDPAAIRMLMEAGADPSVPEKMPGKAKFLRHVSRIFRALGNTQMRGLNTMLEHHPGLHKATPAHLAGRKGHIDKVRLLAEHAQFDGRALKDAKGRTPVDMCARTVAPCREPPALMQKALDAVVPSAAAQVPAAKRGKSVSRSALQVAPYVAAAPASSTAAYPVGAAPAAA